MANWAPERPQVDADVQNAMMDERFRYFHFPRSLSQGTVQEVAACPACFAKWVTEADRGGLDGPAEEQPELQPPQCQAAACLPVAVGAPQAALPRPHVPTPVIGQARSGQDQAAALMSHLSELSQLRREGLLSDEELSASKQFLFRLQPGQAGPAA